MSRRRYAHVDAFTTEPYLGNSAGVVLDSAGLGDADMRRIAAELRHSETAFILPPLRGGDFALRFFTPAAEVDLCGHATVAAAWILSADGKGPFGRGPKARVETNAGVLDLEVERDAAGLPRRVWMTQAPPRVEPVDLSPGILADLLGLEPADIAVSIGPIQRAWTGNWHLMVPVWTREAMDGCRPDFAALATLNLDFGVVTTHLWCAGDLKDRGAIAVRDFAPAVGVAEDPVTGSANGALGGYLVLNGLRPAPAAFAALQGHAIGRPGEVWVEATRDRVRIAGAACVVLLGELRERAEK